ncbi:aspartate kinase [Exidia glandulosa HHB12029]|uniref:aspartate kinase n=1 Tax=Exidia glandulosa HHB12029 TaxID=1314781 RepID=A0A165EUJ9_EXIGL|nr:aspartate kinase [Exidia glandulosa HHB12029]
MSLSDESQPASPSSSASTSSAPSPPTPPNLHQNTVDPAARWLVQKYGGTSVGKFAAKIAEDILPGYLDQHKVAVVCSARSGSTKALGTTNLLLRAASEALQRPNTPTATPGNQTPAAYPWTRQNSLSMSSTSPPGTPQRVNGTRSGSPDFTPISSVPDVKSVAPFTATVDLILSEHVTAARSLIRNEELLKELEQEMERDCEALRSFLFAAQVIHEISSRSKDSIMGVGERLACKLVAAVLRDRGIDSEFVSLENIVPAISDEQEVSFGADGQLEQPFYDALTTVLGDRIRECGSRVPVVTGFFGPVPGSLLRQVGRGYTDLLSALLAVGLEASELQIWKEVDGIFTADPRKVPTARLVPIISPDEAAELTYYGSEVVHPFTMEQVIRRSIPIRIKNVENPTGGGTVIHPTAHIDEPEVPVGTSALAQLPPAVPFLPGTMAPIIVARPPRPPRKSPTAVTIKERIIVLNVNSNRKSVSHGFLARIFGTLDAFGIVVDLISTSEVHVSMAIEDRSERKSVDRLVRELQKLGSVSLHRDMAILSLVGKSMHKMVGIAGRMFSTLAEGGVNIEMISQGASEINISCVIDGRDATKALNLVHRDCLQVGADANQGRGAFVLHFS